MANYIFILCGFLSLAVFSASASQKRLFDETEPLDLPVYNMTKQNYLDLTNDTVFDKDFTDYGMVIYSQNYYISDRARKFASGDFTLAFDVNQTTKSWLGFTTTTSAQSVQAAIQIVNNVLQSIDITDQSSLKIDTTSLKKVLTAYINLVVPNLILYKVALPDLYVDTKLLKIWNPTYVYQSQLVPDLELKFHGFQSNLKNSLGVTGNITCKIDGYSQYLSYTPRYRGKTLSVLGAQVVFRLTGHDIRNAVIEVDEAAVRPFPQRDIIELATAFYKNVVVPEIKKLL